jgi:dihydroorotate dehydrogenase
MLEFLYKRVLKPTLFLFDPEWVHDVFVGVGAWLGKSRISRAFTRVMYGYRGADASVVVDGIRYRTPVLLAAGFDYNGRLATILDAVGFGGEEIGSVTARPCEGNAKPRLKRMVKSKSLVVYKGLRNAGVDAIIEHLKSKTKPNDFVWGISIAKTNDAESVSTIAGINDYCYSYQRLLEESVGDFYTINISCPNVHGGESFAEPERLKQLLHALFEYGAAKPVYVKMPINETSDDFLSLLEVLNDFPVSGVVIGNLNKNYAEANYPEEAPSAYRGGLSGAPCNKRSLELVKLTRSVYGKRFTIIGCGGVMSVSDARVMFEAGADLIQLISGMIFEGPHLISAVANDYANQKNRAVDLQQSVAPKPVMAER